MHFIVRALTVQSGRSQHGHHLQIHRRTLVDTTIKCVRDRGLDHAVEKEKNLLPMMNIKNFIKLEPSKSVPITIISKNRENLKIPIRPIDFIRKYPSIFEEFLPGKIDVHPHVRLTPKVLELDADEQLMYQSDNYKQQAADRLLKLLMLSRFNKIPLSIVNCLKWDLGLPQDYEQSIVPEFPDYFQIAAAKDSDFGLEDARVLELVCWSEELATSVMEKKVTKTESGYTKGMPVAFPMKFSKGFEMDKKFKKWMDEWQKLPYISPYDNASHLLSKSDESDKWAVAVLHELLHILVPKKTEKDNILCLGEYFGIRSRFKRAILNHPGIFYLSSKNRTYTVVLKEGYKRGSLIENHPLMTLRNRYIHLMNMVKEDGKVISKPQQKQISNVEDRGGELDTDDNEIEQQDLDDSSEDEVEGVSTNDNEAEEKEDGVQQNVGNNSGRRSRKMNQYEKGPSRDFKRERPVRKLPVQRSFVNNSGRRSRKMNLDEKGPSRDIKRETSVREHPQKMKEGVPSNDYQRTEGDNRYSSHKRKGRSLAAKSPV